MFKTAGLFEENPIQGNVAGVSAEIPDLFGSKFDRLNPSSQIAVGDTNVLFDTSYNLTQKPDWAALRLVVRSTFWTHSPTSVSHRQEATILNLIVV
jgi:hypothetical protein